MESMRGNSSQLYTFCSAKKIYFAHTPSKYLLMEKKKTSSQTRVISLVSRNTVLISKKNGVLLFPNS